MLSAQLGTVAAQRGAARRGTRLRSPAGLRRRLTVLRALERGEGARAPVEAAAAWARYSNDPAARETLIAAEFTGGASAFPPLAPSNPLWTRAETIMALVAYLAVRPTYASRDHPVVCELSEFLQRYGSHPSHKRAASYRNPDSVARKVNKFRAAEAGKPPLRARGATLESEIWSLFLERPAAILAEAEEIRVANDVSRGALPREPFPSRGPSPWEGEFGASRDFNGPHHLYLMMLCIGDSAPRWFKLGYSRDLARRLGELNFGMPPGAGIRWVLIGHRPFHGAQAAFEAEQGLLGELHVAGYCRGGEFIELDLPRALNLLSRTARR